MINEIREYLYLIIFYYVEYYLIPNGCLVDRLPICVNGYTACMTGFLIACELLED